MGKLVALMTTSLDGYYAGPDDGPGRGLGEGGERLHYWVFGGPWSYDRPPTGDATGVDRQLLDDAFGRIGAVVAGRWTYESAGGWGGTNPFAVPLVILTHRPQDEPAGGEFRFVDGLDQALAQAREAAGPKDVSLMGGDVIRQVLARGQLDELVVSIAPVLLGAGKRLFGDSAAGVELEQVDAVRSPWATHLRYQVKAA
jgi:dihydrofolate reductase